jgi:hypothetical protein
MTRQVSKFSSRYNITYKKEAAKIRLYKQLNLNPVKNQFEFCRKV